MSHIKFYLCMFFVMCGAIVASGQTMNKLYICSIQSPIGREIQIPVQMENTDEVVALQFDIEVPDKINILNYAVGTNRWNDHEVVVKKIGNGRSRLMVYSPSNKPFKGNSGHILILKAHVSETCVEGEEYPLHFKETILTKSNGENCVTATQDGKIVIEKSPDLVPEWINIRKTSVNPSDTIQCSWKVKNIGGIPTSGGWKEQLFAVSEDGKNQVLLCSQYCENAISSQGETIRNFKISLPDVPGIDGKCALMIKIIPDANCGEPTSMTGNNSCQSNQLINIAKCLYLESINQAVDENSSTPLKYKLTRSGSTLQKEVFNINVKHTDNRLTFPATVEIPRNQSSAYFYVTIVANGKPDESDSVEFSVLGNEYPEVSTVIPIIDDTFPKLNLTLSKDEVKEGESFILTIELPRSFPNDKVIFLSSDNSAKISVPEEVVIPSGKSTIDVPISVIDNDDAELETTVTIRATSADLEREDCEILVLDDDMPTLSLSFSPSEVNESAGTSAVIATVRRLTNVDKNVKLLLFDDSKGAIDLSHKTLSMGKGAESVQFIIDIKDNDIVDGNKLYNVTAAVYSSACDCYASELSGGLVSQTLTVLDDDGPHLSITSVSQAFLEGSSDNVITITRNTNPDSDITVTISSDKDDLLDYNHSVVIPAGATSADVKVSVSGNETSGDGDIVSFKAESANMAAGTCWVVLTDQTLPDATIQLNVAQDSPSAGESVDLILTISNIGNASLQRNTPIDISCTGIKGAKRVYTKKAIEKGDNYRLVIEDFQLPERTGLVTLSAVINDNESVTELLYSNNRAKSVELILTPAFDVSASVDKNIYKQEEIVIISGKASGEAGKNAKIEIHLTNNGIRQVLNTTTDDDGNYEYKHKLLNRQTGHFTVSACYPTSSPVEDAATFYVYGLQLDKAFITCEPGLGETVNGTFRLSNPGNLSQTSLKIEKTSIPENCEFTFDAPSEIGSGETVDINFSLKGIGLSSGKDFEKIPLSITTAEGTKTTFTVYYYIQSLHGKLYTSTPSISTTMLKDTPRDYPLVIRNIGKGETGKITFALPSWVETATPREMASLAAGDSTTVMLRFKSMDEMKLNVATRGKLGINCSNGDGISVSFDIMPVSEVIGKLKVDVVDEFTFYTEEAPHVSNAQIKITHPTSKEVIVEGRTGNDGIYTAEMKEGWYIMSVEADNHDIYTENIIISPGTELTKEVFMPYQAITYNWTVEETEIDDEYVFETTVDFDTRVPKPVIVISLPDEKPEPYSVIPVKITNKGLINAVNIEMSLEVSDGYTLEFLNDPTAEVLAPQQTLVFYAKLIPTGSGSEVRAKAPRASRECIWIISKAKYQELCQKYTGDQFVEMLKKYGKKSCFNSGSGSSSSGGQGGSYGGSGGGVGRPGCWGGGSSYGSDYYVIDWRNPEKYCDRKPDANPLDGNPLDGNDNDPIDLPKVDEGNPDDLPCDSEEEPKLVYKLIPVSGERYQMNGVAADGVSQVKIVLDPTQSSIPSQDCDNFYGFSWLLLKDGEVVEDDDRFGSIEQISDWEAIYTAPSYFVEDKGSVTTVEAQLRYRHKDPTLPTNYEGWLKEAPRVKIEIVRPPVVFIHGLGDNRTCWYTTSNYLEEMGYYKKYFNYRVDYRETNASTFMSNVGVVSDGIYTARKKAAKLGYVATKCDLVGHSMGGILARLFVERSGKTKNVNRVITVNTPHAGSELGDMVSAHNVVLKRAAQLFYGKDDIDAVKDLAVESDEMALLVTVPGNLDIPCYAIGTQSDLRDIIVRGGAIAITHLSGVAFGASLAGAILDPEPITKTLLAVISIACGDLALEGRHLLDDYVQVGEGDLIVSSESQIGGCEAFELIEHGPWHCNSPKDYKVITRLTELLKTPSSDASFSTNWFNPKKRNFNHPNNWELWGQRILNVLSNIIPSSQWGDLISIGASEWSFLDNVGFSIDVFMNNIPKSPAIRAESTSSMQQRVLKINLALPVELTHTLSFVYMNGHLAYILQGEDNQFNIPSTYSGDVSVKIFLKDSQGNLFSDERVINIDAPLAKPISIVADNVDIIEGKDTYLSLECIWNDNTRTFVNADEVVIENGSIACYSNGILKGLRKGKTSATIFYAGVSCNAEIVVYPSEIDYDDDSDAICSTVTLSFKQSAVMTRQAFRGIFSLNNGHQTATLRDFKLNLEVKDEDGVVATRREFEITPEKLAGFQGGLDFNSGWSLEPSHNGEASILFIPSKYAAPTEPKEYSFGGTFSYTDPYTGLTVTRTLNPVTLTVNPSPQLELTYFMQRDVFGDDPLTEEIEPMKPAEFALLLNNTGAGDATSLKLTTGQPQIVSNEKGLYINFELVSSQLNGSEKSLMLGGSAVTDFGSLKAGEQSYAQWWLQSSLLGHFVKYDVKSTHVTSHDYPNLSLVDTVTIHELIHGFDLMNEEIRRRAFLVNDISDILDTPDQLYFTDGTQADVVIARDALITKESDLEYILNVSASAPGWNYGTISDPTNGRQSLSSIKRISDGVELAIDNFWQTDRTLRDGKDPLAENLLHFIDNFSNSNVSYRLTFTPKPDIELALDSIIGLPGEDDILSEQLKTVTVKFNKPIDSSTFTIADLSMSCQGERIDISQVAITSKTDTEFELDLSSATLENGFYVLSIQTTSISDVEGFAGGPGKQVSWVQYVDGKVKLTTTVTPIEGGAVTPMTGLYDYDSSVKLQATPSDGYIFLGWWCDDDLISEARETEVYLIEDKNYIARFALKQFNISVDDSSENGVITGAQTGIYSYGEELTFVAEANENYEFAYWLINNEIVESKDPVLILKVNGDLTVTAYYRYIGLYYHQLNLYQGWNWISSYLNSSSVNAITLMENDKLLRILSQSSEVIRDPELGLIGLLSDLSPTESYKVESEGTVKIKLSSYDCWDTSSPIYLQKGWNWLGYPLTHESSVEDALSNISTETLDVIVGQEGFAQFDGQNWIGTLDTLSPGQGYMYQSQSNKYITYSSGNGKTPAKSKRFLVSNYPQANIDIHKYMSIMPIIAQIVNTDNEPLFNENYQVEAYCGSECRGIGQIINGLIMMNVYGNPKDHITFKITDKTGSVISIKNPEISFSENVIGNLIEPYELTTDICTGIGSTYTNSRIFVGVVDNMLVITGIDLNNIDLVDIYDIDGLKIVSKNKITESGIKISHLNSGVYIVNVYANNNCSHHKIVVR